MIIRFPTGMSEYWLPYTLITNRISTFMVSYVYSTVWIRSPRNPREEPHKAELGPKVYRARYPDINQHIAM